MRTCEVHAVVCDPIGLCMAYNRGIKELIMTYTMVAIFIYLFIYFCVPFQCFEMILTLSFVCLDFS